MFDVRDFGRGFVWDLRIFGPLFGFFVHWSEICEFCSGFARFVRDFAVYAKEASRGVRGVAETQPGFGFRRLGFGVRAEGEPDASQAPRRGVSAGHTEESVREAFTPSCTCNSYQHFYNQYEHIKISRTMPRVLWWPQGGAVSYERGLMAVPGGGGFL